MTDITSKFLKIQLFKPAPLIPVIKESSEIVFFTQYSSLRNELVKLENIYSNLKSSLPSDHLHDREALSFLAHCHQEIEKLKQMKSNPLLVGIVKCLYSQIKQLTTIIEKIQKIKQNTNKTLKSMEKSRSQINEDVKIERSIIEDVQTSAEFKQTNQLLFIELNKSDQVLESTQETVFQLSSLLKHFSQIVDEQESMSLNILVDAETSVQNMKTANVELQSANERSKGYEKIWAGYFLILSLILLFYDWKTSRVVYIVD